LIQSYHPKNLFRVKVKRDEISSSICPQKYGSREKAASDITRVAFAKKNGDTTKKTKNSCKNCKKILFKDIVIRRE